MQRGSGPAFKVTLSSVLAPLSGRHAPHSDEWQQQGEKQLLWTLQQRSQG